MEALGFKCLRFGVAQGLPSNEGTLGGCFVGPEVQTRGPVVSRVRGTELCLPFPLADVVL